VVKVRVLGSYNRVGVAGFGLALGWWVWLEGARGALSTGGIFKRIGAVLSFRCSICVIKRLQDLIKYQIKLFRKPIR
jgi:hypothetical protein